jgi:hypothetical protein
MSLTKLSVDGNNYCKLFPARESLFSDTPSGDGKMANLFYSLFSWYFISGTKSEDDSSRGLLPETLVLKHVKILGFLTNELESELLMSEKTRLDPIIILSQAFLEEAKSLVFSESVW